MKTIYTVIVAIILALTLTSSIKSQNLLTEDFNYTQGTFLRDNGWLVTSGTGGIAVNSYGLSYEGYPGSEGNSVTISGLTSEDNRKEFSAVTSGSVYASALINVTSQNSITGDYFFHFGTGNSTFMGKLFTRKDPVSGFQFGISKTMSSSTSPVIVWSNAQSFGTTYLIVLKYTFVDGTFNDRVDFYLNPTPGAPEPDPTLTTTDGGTGNDNPKITGIYLRQSSTTNDPVAIIDGIRVSTTWDDLPLPVELSSFTAIFSGRDVSLNWSTQTEKNSDKFVVERKSNLDVWESIGSVKASVLSNSPKQYLFVDKCLQSGKYQYRLKMIDNDGSFAYSKTIDTDISTPMSFELCQNYPNPFNPSTKIDYNIPANSKVTLEVYNITGKMICQLVNEEQSAGFYSIDFNSSSVNRSLSSGVYFYKITISNNTIGSNLSSIKKMILLK